MELGFVGTVMAILVALAIRDWLFKPAKIPVENRRRSTKETRR
jgi:hypothetical protein